MTTNLLSLSTGSIAGASIAVLFLIIIIVVTVLLISKKRIIKNSNGLSKTIEFSGDNTKLFENIDAIKKLSNDSVVIVPPTHYAIIIRNGSIVNVCESGEYPLCDAKTTKKDIRSLKIIYISKTVKVTVRWGTKIHQRIEYIDAILGKPVSIGAFGVMDIRVANPKKFYLELVANFGTEFSTDDLQERIRTLVVDDTLKTIGNVIRDNKISYVDFSSVKYDIQSRVGVLLAEKFTDSFGFTVSDFIIENINLTDEQTSEIKKVYSEDSSFEREKVLLKRNQELEELERQAERHRKEAIKEDSELDDFIYQRERDRQREQIEYERKLRHEDEDRVWGREDKLIDVGERVQNKMYDTYKEVENGRSDAQKTTGSSVNTEYMGNAGHHCSICGTAYKPDSKYCPGCGAILPKENIKIKCPQCSTELSWGTAYCPKCGHKIEN